MQAQFKTYVYDTMSENGQGQLMLVGLEEILNDCDVLSYVSVNNEVRAVIKHGQQVLEVDISRLVVRPIEVA